MFRTAKEMCVLAEILREKMNSSNNSDLVDPFERFQNGDINYAHNLINERIISPNLCDKNHCSLLHWAVANHHDKIVELLLNYGANPNLQGGKLCETPLHWAIRLKYLKIMQLLIQNGANLKIQSVQGLDSLHMACEIGDPAVVFLLLSSNADPNSLNSAGNTPIISLLKSDLPPIEDIFRLLIRFGADINARENETGNTVFHLMNNKMISSRLLVLLSTNSPSTPFTAVNSANQTPIQMARLSSNRRTLLWTQLWMYHTLPLWTPILSVSLTCLLFLIFIDTFGWIYGFLTWFLLTITIFDKLSQGIIERGMCRIHQGLVWGYYLSIIWINLRYFGGINVQSEYFFYFGRDYPSTVNMSSPDQPSIICTLSILSLILSIIVSFKKPRPYNSMEDRSSLLSRIVSKSDALMIDESTGPAKLCATCLIDRPSIHCPYCETCASDYFEQHFSFTNNCISSGNRRLMCLFVFAAGCTSVLFSYHTGGVILSHDLFTKNSSITSFFSIHLRAFRIIPSIAIMFWLSALISCLQWLFLAQQLYLVGHETTSYYVINSGRQLLPVPFSRFLKNLIQFLWNGSYSVSQGQKAYKLWTSSSEETSSTNQYRRIHTEEFTFQPLRLAPPSPPSSCCQHHDCDLETGSISAEGKGSDTPVMNATMER